MLILPCVVDMRESELARIAARMFKLTAAEGWVVAHLASGRKPDGIAEQMGVKSSTVRSHLKSIFAKTGTTCQLEVSALIHDLW